MPNYDGAIEVWLTKKNLMGHCMVVHEDESTTAVDIESLSSRGAQREVTIHLRQDGYTPAGRWKPECVASDGVVLESSRQFKTVCGRGWVTQ